MIPSQAIGPILILMSLIAFAVVPAHALALTVGPLPVLQTGIQQYVTLLPKVPSSNPSPWLIYPTSSTIWVAGIATGNPPTSQIREFFINGTSIPVVSLSNTVVSSILADP